MTGRADWSLELQLAKTADEAVDTDVKDAIAAVIARMHSGTGAIDAAG